MEIKKYIQKIKRLFSRRYINLGTTFNLQKRGIIPVF